jgi:hypothetical protein
VTRLNRKPIFIVGLSRGGSSILLNLLRSHPEVCSPRGETHEVFYGKPSESLATRLSKAFRYAPIALLQREHLFSPHSCRERKPLTAASMTMIDRVLYREKQLATGTTQNRYRTEGVEYTAQELRDSRVLCKNLDGMAFTSSLFASLYPDATFFGLVRNGLATCEGHVRRGRSAQAYGKLYASVCGRIAADATRLPNFHLLRYEALTRDILATAANLFRLATLDASSVPKFRLVVGNEGNEGRTGGTAEHLRWYTPAQFAELIAPSVDDEQIRKLSPKDREAFLREAGGVMEQLGYL